MTVAHEPLHADATKLAAEARAYLERETEGALPGDFADVVGRASALPDTLVSVQDAELAESLASHTDRDLAAASSFGTLEDFLDDAASFVASQATGETPPMRAAVAPGEPERPKHQQRLGPLVAIGMAVAAALVLVPWLSDALWHARPASQTEPEGYLSAIDHAKEDRSEKTTPASERESGSASRPEPAQPEPPEMPELQPEPPEPDPPATARGDTRKRSKIDRIGALDTAAREAWRRGDLDGARGKLEELVRLAGRRDIADIAYGDLFSLARQQGDTRQLRRYWKRYTSKFPAGRYIDDARAGLCRTAPQGEQRACWRAYLEDRPQGTYHQHAADVLARPE